MGRRAVTVNGIVQGVGFRPFVHRAATELRLGGFVRNEMGEVQIEVEGPEDSLDRFMEILIRNPPPLARIDAVQARQIDPKGEGQFQIGESGIAGAPETIFIPPDVAPCAECLRELFAADDRRYRYPFLNCTACGPRLTIILGAPYDRERTTMAAFPMCAACRREYANPTDRRFHAEPTACPACGPRLRLTGGAGEPLDAADPVRGAAALLRDGRIGAVKGMGGFHLICDATREDVVAELRRRKKRAEKPFAIMVADLAAAERLCEMGREEGAALASARAPIVLLRRRGNYCVAEAVAPGNPQLGVMLPSTPLHHLLMQELQTVPLVATSGNRSDEPIASEDLDALKRLSEIADFFLLHNRPIRVRCDDSVVVEVAGKIAPMRRSRGFAPEPIALPMACPRPILAVGGQLKATFALGRGRHAVVSHHLGDLDHYRALAAFRSDIALYEETLSSRPAVLAHDLHPDYASTLYARERAVREGLGLLGVQHHHAHMAACMAEHGLLGKVIGVVFDGSGYGTDGTIWGGEVLVGDFASFSRAAHLSPVRMPGGDRAVREPWRMALSWLREAGADASIISERLPASDVRLVEEMLERGLNSPATTSAGRLFDAAAAIIGVRERVTFEAQAAMELEWLASAASAESGTYPFELIREQDGGPWIMDSRPVVRALAEEVAAGRARETVALRFHRSIGAAIVEVCQRVAEETRIQRVVLSGGVFANRLLTEDVLQRLAGIGLEVYRHETVPCNDGGLSLGQLAIAAASLGGTIEGGLRCV